MRARVEAARARGELPPVDECSLENAYYPLAKMLAAGSRQDAGVPRLIAIVGPPGSGKTTIASYLQLMFEAGYGLRAARFGIDDAYLSRDERVQLAQRVHPLFAIRGAPGTHRIEWITETIESLNAAEATSRTPLPRFDKLVDDSVPRNEWPTFLGKPDVIIFDTWLWEVDAPSEESLLVPINDREAREDSEAIWRRYAARTLARDYVPVFQGADEWVLLESPSFDATIRFRAEQEVNRKGSKSEPGRTEREAELRGFLELFERWLDLPHRTSPDHRIILDDHHEARLDSSTSRG